MMMHTVPESCTCRYCRSVFDVEAQEDDPTLLTIERADRLRKRGVYVQTWLDGVQVTHLAVTAKEGRTVGDGADGWIIMYRGDLINNQPFVCPVGMDDPETVHCCTLLRRGNVIGLYWDR